MGRHRAAGHLLIALVSLAALGCGPSWVGTWQGTADIGPVDAYTLELRLDTDAPSAVTLTAPDGSERPHLLCSQQVTGRTLTLELVAQPGACDKGPRLRLVGALGARVIHGPIYEGTRKTGFFRAFPKPPPAPEVRAD